MDINVFKKDFAGSAFRTIDGTRRVAGKFCEIEELGDGWDVWLVRADREPIGARKLNNLCQAIKGMPEYSHDRSPLIRKLDGEAYLHTGSVALVREVAFLCSVKRRKRYSEAVREVMKARMAAFNKKPACQNGQTG